MFGFPVEIGVSMKEIFDIIELLGELFVDLVPSRVYGLRCVGYR